MEHVYRITAMTSADRESVMAIFNHYIENSFAAYRETALPDEAFDQILASCSGYPSGVIRDRDGEVLGFGLLRPHKPIPEFSHTAEVCCFLYASHLRKGLGTRMLAHLEAAAAKRGITTLLASISSLNPDSQVFHLRHGFQQCGRFRAVGKKRGITFDTVWMQKDLASEIIDNSEE
jgi:L-amino acid N-acyltransferase YncA